MEGRQWNTKLDEPWGVSERKGENRSHHDPISHGEKVNWEFAVKDKVHCTASNRNGIVTGLRYTVGVQANVKDYQVCYSIDDKVEYEWELAGWLQKGHQTIID